MKLQTCYSICLIETILSRVSVRSHYCVVRVWCLDDAENNIVLLSSLLQYLMQLPLSLPVPLCVCVCVSVSVCVFVCVCGLVHIGVSLCSSVP